MAVERLSPTAFAGTALGLRFLAATFAQRLSGHLSAESQANPRALASDHTDFDYFAMHETVEAHDDHFNIILVRLQSISFYTDCYPFMALAATDEACASLGVSQKLRTGHDHLQYQTKDQFEAAQTGSYPTHNPPLDWRTLVARPNLRPNSTPTRLPLPQAAHGHVG